MKRRRGDDLPGEEGEGGNGGEQQRHGGLVLVLAVRGRPRAHVEEDGGVLQHGGGVHVEEHAAADAHVLFRLVGDLVMKLETQPHGGEGLAVGGGQPFARSNDAVAKHFLRLAGSDIAGTRRQGGGEG